MSGGISFEKLYGSPEGAPDPAEATRTVRQVIPRGTTPSAPLSVPFVARAVQADNASGSWYLINGRRIPPWTVSAVVALDPPSAQITVQAATPAGHKAEAVGADLVLVITEQGLAPFAGIYVPPAVAFDYAQARVIRRAVEGGVAGTLFVNTSPTVALVITQVQLIAFDVALLKVRDLVVGSVGWGGVPPATVVAYAAISPGKPSDTPVLDPQAVQLPPGEDIAYTLITATGGGASDVVLAVTYYRIQ